MGVNQREALHKDQMLQCISNLRMWLLSEHPANHDWVSSHSGEADMICSPMQGNMFDCGVFTVLAATCEALNIELSDLPWGQQLQHAALIRTQLAALIMTPL